MSVREILGGDSNKRQGSAQYQDACNRGSGYWSMTRACRKAVQQALHRRVLHPNGGSARSLRRARIRQGLPAASGARVVRNPFLHQLDPRPGRLFSCIVPGEWKVKTQSFERGTHARQLGPQQQGRFRHGQDDRTCLRSRDRLPLWEDHAPTGILVLRHEHIARDVVDHVPRTDEFARGSPPAARTKLDLALRAHELEQ